MNNLVYTKSNNMQSSQPKTIETSRCHQYKKGNTGSYKKNYENNKLLVN